MIRTREERNVEWETRMRALKQAVNELRGMKGKEMPSYVKPMLSLDCIKTRVSKAPNNYYEKYVKTISSALINHLVYEGMAFCYLLALPEERRHLKHQRHEHEHSRN